MSAPLMVGAILIGDEILSGKRQDKHFSALQAILAARQLSLSWVRIVGDDEALLTQTLRETAQLAANSHTPHIVFSFGGIGATPDDRTRQCSATAFNKPLVNHAEAAQIIIDRFGDEAYPHRIHMADFPEGASLIPNPVNGIAGYCSNQHYFVPGFTKMAWPMVEWVLDTHYADAKHAVEERRFSVHDIPESDLIPIMQNLLAEFSALDISCLPNAARDEYQIDLGLRSDDQHTLEQATTQLRDWLDQRKIRYEPL